MIEKRKKDSFSIKTFKNGLNGFSYKKTEIRNTKVTYLTLHNFKMFLMKLIFLKVV